MVKKRGRFVVSLHYSKPSFGQKLGRVTIPFWKLFLPSEKKLLSSGVAFRSQKGIVLRAIDGNPITEGLRNVAYANLPKSFEGRVIAERVSLLRQLRALGYKTAIPEFKGSDPRKLLPKIKKKTGARLFSAGLPVQLRVENGRKIVSIDESINWARDLWVNVNGNRIKRFRKGEVAFGEGGKVIQLSEKVFLVNSSLRNTKAAVFLKEKGFSLFFTENFERFDEPVSKLVGKNFFAMNNHVDLFAGVVGDIFLVQKDFFRKNDETITEAIKAAGLKLLFVPKEEELLCPANFLVLPDNSVLMEKAAVKTIQLLRNNGIKVIPTAISLNANRALNGGVRCIVNEL